MLPLAAAACSGPTTSTEPSPSESSAAASPTDGGGSTGNPAPPPRRPFIQQLVANGKVDLLLIEPLPAGATCTGRVVWRRGSDAINAATLPSMTARSDSSTLTWSSPLGRPPDNVSVTWSVDCTLLDRSQGSPVQRFQHLERTFGETQTQTPVTTPSPRTPSASPSASRPP